MGDAATRRELSRAIATKPGFCIKPWRVCDRVILTVAGLP